MKAILHTEISVTPLRPETCNSVTRAIKNEITRIKKNARALGREHARLFANGDQHEATVYTRLFTEEALTKLRNKPEKFPLKDYLPSWMTAPRWTTGTRRKAAKMEAYGLNRVPFLTTVDENNKPVAVLKIKDLTMYAKELKTA